MDLSPQPGPTFVLWDRYKIFSDTLTPRGLVPRLCDFALPSILIPASRLLLLVYTARWVTEGDRRFEAKPCPLANNSVLCDIHSVKDPQAETQACHHRDGR